MLLLPRTSLAALTRGTRRLMVHKMLDGSGTLSVFDQPGRYNCPRIIRSLILSSGHLPPGSFMLSSRYLYNPEASILSLFPFNLLFFRSPGLLEASR